MLKYLGPENNSHFHGTRVSSLFSTLRWLANSMGERPTAEVGTWNTIMAVAPGRNHSPDMGIRLLPGLTGDGDWVADTFDGSTGRWERRPPPWGRRGMLLCCPGPNRQQPLFSVGFRCPGFLPAFCQKPAFLITSVTFKCHNNHFPPQESGVHRDSSRPRKKPIRKQNTNQECL